MCKKLKLELSQSNHRERTFLKLLKKTDEFGAQAEQLEQEYDKLYEQGEYQFNLSNEQKFIEVCNKIQIPMLDLSIIHIQQQEGDDESSATGNQGEEESGSQQSAVIHKHASDIDPNIDMSMIMHDQDQSLETDEDALMAQELIFAKRKQGLKLNQVLNNEAPSESELSESHLSDKSIKVQ